MSTWFFDFRIPATYGNSLPSGLSLPAASRLSLLPGRSGLIVCNEGAASDDYEDVILLDDVSSDNAQLYLQFRYLGSNTSSTSNYGGPSAVFSRSDASNFHIASIASGTGRQMGLMRVSSGSGSALALETAGFTETKVLNKQYCFRAQKNGTTLRSRDWVFGGTEPSSWNPSVTTATAGTGSIGAAFFCGQNTWLLECLGFGTDGDSAPSAVTPTTISGTVTDATNSAVERTVRVYDRASGALLGETTSNASTGAYSIDIYHTGEVDVLFLDDAAGDLYNDLVHRVLL